MLFKTHFAIGVFFLLVFLPHVNYTLVFVPVILAASVIPDIDNAFSTVGKTKILRFLQWITKHRGFIHSMTACVILSLILTWIYPPLAFPFFLGYGIHLFADSLTIDGIKPFWPLKGETKWKIRVGGKIEYVIFIVFCVIDAILLIGMFI